MQSATIRGLKAMVAGCLFLACGCTGTAPQTFSGALSGEWPGWPVEIRAESGSTVVSAMLGHARSFRFDLPGQRTYHLYVVDADGSRVPMVFPRAGGLASDSLAVRGGAAPFDLGLVRRLAPFDSAAVLISAKSLSSGGETDGDSDEVECEDGVDAITGLACVEEDDEVGVCEGDDDDVEEECEDGVDALTGLACVDDDDEDDGEADDHDDGEVDEDDDEDSDQPMPLALSVASVPEFVPPSGIGSCGDEDDDEDEGEDDDKDDDEAED
jgi:hypothetical protein